jgi:hypothetical protein
LWFDTLAATKKRINEARLSKSDPITGTATISAPSALMHQINGTPGIRDYRDRDLETLRGTPNNSEKKC